MMKPNIFILIVLLIIWLTMSLAVIREQQITINQLKKQLAYK